ncbi:protein-disulfide reductase DsbD [Psychrobium sp. 1_MG-2023]|uniref:protein-disulfide reductase DsbD n=1 Tax=Psychrobium sp. 1_MG-2023 TaxID=3062624 RepID=UPI000C31D3CB|nr:protein-disulfide reductase DsbD [Psychrobium sp. 1_MG-2023]MDP2559571.1 protein-disulfide reductase DsbD [Psychrobium sp. 1_MG-2023]PKF59410.1 protein-disulfide reductase DsbD [Alteromonadales bacterium alter-6D02]
MKHIITSLLLSVLSLFFVAPTQANALTDLFSQQPKFLPEEQAFQLNFDQANNKIIVRWQIADGYYLYKEKFKFTSDTATITEITLPKGSDHYDEYFGQQEVYYQEAVFSFIPTPSSQEHQITLAYQGCADAGLCYPPSTKTLYFDPRFVTTNTVQDLPPAAQVPEQDYLAGLLSSDSLLWTLVIFFGLGIGLAFTPCVFPMYPILSGIIVGAGNKLSTRQAFALSFTYVQGMALTYSALGLVVASLGLQFQAAFQHPILLSALAILFTILALSMFGLFNLQLPSAWQERLNSLSNKQQGGRYPSVFMMGMISGLVASPCTTAPLSGALIYVAQTGDLVLGFLTLYILSLGMGIPLLLMGSSGGKLLPKAGAWMDVIKGLFGFMLLSVVIVLLERFLDPIWVMSGWSLLAIGVASYLLHHNKSTALNIAHSIRHTLCSVLLIAGTVTLIKPWLFDDVAVTQQQQENVEFIQVKGIAQLNQELAKAKQQNKPVMLDFFADWCIACKDFEHKTFSDPLVKPLLEQMVLIQSDVTANDELDIELQEKLGVLGLPTIMFYNPQGVEQKHLRVVGFQGPEQFKTMVEQAF